MGRSHYKKNGDLISGLSFFLAVCQIDYSVSLAWYVVMVPVHNVTGKYDISDWD